jgi:hypothetical protein
LAHTFKGLGGSIGAQGIQKAAADLKIVKNYLHQTVGIGNAAATEFQRLMEHYEYDAAVSLLQPFAA